MIAILAILISVFIPSFSRYIDNSRYSNDVVSARSMTTILENHLITEGGSVLDAHDIRTIIDGYNGGPYEYTPEARNTGFFYIEDTNEIRAIRYDEAETVIAAITGLKGNATVTLSSEVLSNGYESSPEEVFGTGSHLITTEGSSVAMAVDFVRNMARHGSAIGATYDAVIGGLGTLESNAFIRFFSSEVSEDVIGLITDMMTHYDPDTTLFVSNTGWSTGRPNEAVDITKVVFTAGLTNIPTFPYAQVRYTGTDLTLPDTVRTISSGALSGDAFPNLTTVYVESGVEIRAEEGALKENITLEDVVIISASDLIDYSAYVVISSALGTVTYDLGQLPIRESVTGYTIDVNGSVITMKIYTDQGLVGYATNLVTVNYRLNQGDSYTYFSTRSASGVFMTPPDPLKSGHVFNGWVYLDGSGAQTAVTDNAVLPEGLPEIEVFATWTVAS